MPVTNRKKLFQHEFTEGGTKFIIRVPDYYEGNGSSIDGAVGITKLPAGYEIKPQDMPISVRQAIQMGKLGRIRISYSEAGKRRSTKVLCSVSNLDTATAAVLSKSFEGNNIESSGFPQRRKLR